MYQNFDSVSDPSTGPARLELLRQELRRRGLSGFLVPLADEHQCEYIPASAMRLAWLTGFTGSAGLCIALRDRAAIFVDGRYTIQARAEVDATAFTHHHLIDEPPWAWLRGAAEKGGRIGFDPWLHTAADIERFSKALVGTGAELEPLTSNPIDSVWQDKPAPPIGAVSLFPERLAGETAANKIKRIAASIGAAGAAAAVLTQPDSIAWLFNIRGQDVPHTPIPLCFAIVRWQGRPQLFIDGRKLSHAVRDYLADLTDIEAPAAFAAALAALGKDGGAVLVDRGTAAYTVSRLIEGSGGTVIDGRDPVVLPKARKNSAELDATRQAHLRDGAAMVRFLAWFDAEAPKGGLSEISAVEALENFRRETGALREISFDTIAAAGPHAARPHYRVNQRSDRAIGKDEIFLIDSGAQYQDGTTDVTRTLIVGTPTEEMCARNTRVLKGHIAIHRALFPKGTTGAHIDALARLALWEAGLDFDHGTGHGVGIYLSVHEGPQRISKTSHIPLEPGMILSNEPGYYKEGAYGIRIENLIVVTEPRPLPGGERPMMGFETLTFVPIDRRLIKAELLSQAERDWLNAYHRAVRDKISPLLGTDFDRAWLIQATEPL